jgi:uncharacterized protein YkwD
VGRKGWILVVLSGLILLSACAAQSTQSTPPSFFVNIGQSNEVSVGQHPAQAPSVVVQVQEHSTTPTPPTQQNRATHKSVSPTPQPSSPPVNQPTSTSSISIPATGKGYAPYGPPPPLTPLERDLTIKLFNLINSDRAKQGLYPFVWNETLSGGARLHSWNMYHCGFSHTCPDGVDQCVRIAREGFEGVTDCGENIAYAGPFPTPWEGTYKIHESMANEPPTGWHRIHLFSTTLHRVGVGVYVDPDGYIWFTEDMVS